MGQRSLESGHNYGKGNVYVDFSFLTNGAGAISLATLRGVGADTVLSIAHPAAGRYTVTFKDPYRYFVGKTANLEDFASGSDDGAYATDGPVTGEGTAAGPLTFDVFTRAGATTTKTDFAARRVYVSGVLKNSTVGV